MKGNLPASVQRVCARCGEAVKVAQNIVCPTHGVIHSPYQVMTRAAWLVLEATIVRHPAGKTRRKFRPLPPLNGDAL